MSEDNQDTNTETALALPVREEDMQLIRRLRELQERLGVASDSKFAKSRLGVSASTWSRLCTGSYKAENWAPMMKKVRTAIHSIEHLLEARVKGRDLLPFDFVGQLLTGVKVAMGQQRDRLVVFLAPSGGGKSALVPMLAMEYDEGVVKAEATESWATYMACCLAMADALDVPLPKSPSAYAIEAEILRELNERPRKLVIDEAHHMSRAGLNLVKAILNKTPCIVVLLAIPHLWEKLTGRAAAELEQLRTRTCAKIVNTTMESRDLEMFLESRVKRFAEMPDGDRRAAVSALKATCEKLGMWDRASLVATLLNGSAAGEVPSRDDVSEAIKNAEGLQ